MGLNYGDAEREREPPGAKAGGFGFGRGRGKRGAPVLGGRVSVDSMKLKYEEGWDAEAVSKCSRFVTAGRQALLSSPS